MIQLTSLNLNEYATKVNEISRYKGYWTDPNMDSKITECMFYLSGFDLIQTQANEVYYEIFGSIYETKKGSVGPAFKAQINEAFQSVVIGTANDMLAGAFISLLDFAGYEKLQLIRNVQSKRIKELELGVELEYVIRSDNRHTWQKKISTVLAILAIVNKYPPNSKIKDKWQSILISLAMAYISQIAVSLAIDLEKHIHWRMEYMRVMPFKESHK